MRDHSWIRDVLTDLEQFATKNELPEDVTAAIAIAADAARMQLGGFRYIEEVPQRPSSEI